jgi:hypothetical protein
VRVSLSPSACAELADLVQHPVSRSRQGGQSTCATVTERKTGSYPGRWPRSAQRCVATAEATGVGSAWRGRHPGQRPPTDVEQPCEGCGEVHVQGPSCGLVPASDVNWLAHWQPVESRASQDGTGKTSSRLHWCGRGPRRTAVPAGGGGSHPGCSAAARISTPSTSRGPGREKKALASTAMIASAPASSGRPSKLRLASSTAARRS